MHLLVKKIVFTYLHFRYAEKKEIHRDNYKVTVLEAIFLRICQYFTMIHFVRKLRNRSRVPTSQILEFRGKIESGAKILSN